jgi:hypothetical protein
MADAKPAKDAPEIRATMSICECGQPIVAAMGQGYKHAFSGETECDSDARLDPPE